MVTKQSLMNLIKNTNKFNHYKKIIELLVKIQSIKNRKIIIFKNKIYSIPKYNNRILIKEANLFCNWYVKKFSWF